MESARRNRLARLSQVEVLIVVSVLGLIAAFAIPQLSDIRTKASDAKLESDVKVINSAVVFPPEDLRNWFDPSQLATLAAEGTRSGN